MISPAKPPIILVNRCCNTDVILSFMNPEQEPVSPLSWDETLENLRREAAAFEVGDAAAAEAFRLRFLSKKGEVTRLFEAFRALSGPEKKSVGQALNALRQEVEARWKEASAGQARAVAASGATGGFLFSSKALL
ncbi:MAG: hypothetical protein ACO31H_05335, partial [Bacteroidia bacterium]